jgi:uncharacterized protein (TIGR00251 family)
MAGPLPPDSPGRVCPDGVALKLRVTPGAKRNAICETRVWGEDVRLLVRVRADAQDGKANAAVLRLIAEWLDWPMRDVRLVSGERSRLKTVVAHGEPDALFGRLAAAIDRL